MNTLLIRFIPGQLSLLSAWSWWIMTSFYNLYDEERGVNGGILATVCCSSVYCFSDTGGRAYVTLLIAARGRGVYEFHTQLKTWPNQLSFKSHMKGACPAWYSGIRIHREWMVYVCSGQAVRYYICKNVKIPNALVRTPEVYTNTKPTNKLKHSFGLVDLCDIT